MAKAPSDGASIIRAVIERYSRLNSYCDRGAVYRELGTDGPYAHVTFETAYARPNLFRFAFESPYPPLRHLITRCVVGCDGTRSYLCIEHPGKPADLRFGDDVTMVVAGATGISGGSAHTIARLLLGTVGGLSLTDLRDWTIRGSTVVDDVACHRLVGKHLHGEEWELVVERDSLLLRSLSHGLAGEGAQRQVRRDIHVDGVMQPDTFRAPERPRS